MEPIQDVKTRAQVAAAAGMVPIRLRGKVPLDKGWQNKTLPSALEEFSSFKGNNLGVVTGKNSNIAVFDIDLKGGDDDTYRTWKYLTDNYPKFTTFVVRTGGGGYHYYFKYSSAVTVDTNGQQQILQTTNKIGGLNMDFRSDGGQIVFYGSIHPDTHQPYVIAAGSPYEIGDMPPWLAQFIYQNSAYSKKR